MTDTILDFMDNFKESKSPELIRMQEEMYYLGKKEMIENLSKLIPLLPESFFTKDNLIKTFKETLEKLENKENEK